MNSWTRDSVNENREGDLGVARVLADFSGYVEASI